MSNFSAIESSTGLVLGLVSVLLLTFWLAVIVYRLRLTLKRYKYYLKEFVGDSHIRSEVLYALETCRNRDIFLTVLILLDMAMFFCFTLVLPQLNIKVYSSVYFRHKMNEVFGGCKILPLIGFSYMYPANTFMLVTFVMVVITQFMIISFLNQYLALRYLGHSLPNKVVFKYILWWIVQYSIQSICVIPKCLIFLPPIILFFIILDWFYIILSSRKLCRAIRSKLEEIRLFEWNPNNYRIIYKNLKQYRIMMTVFVLVVLSSIIALMFLGTCYLLYLITGNCYLQTVYGINYNISLTQNVRKQMHDIINDLLFGFAFPLALLSGILLLIPSLFMFLLYGINLIYNHFTGKGNLEKINRELFEPLINERYYK